MRSAPPQTETAKVTIQRFNPTDGKGKYLQDYSIPYNQGMSVLDALIYIYENLDSSLGFYYSCKMVKCTGCSIKMNGNAVLACAVPMEKEMKLEPLTYAPLVKDLIVKYRNAQLRLDLQTCNVCTLCVKACPIGIWGLSEKNEIVQVKAASHCIGCKECENICRNNGSSSITVTCDEEAR